MIRILLSILMFLGSTVINAGPLEDQKLVGQIVKGQTLTVGEVSAMEPACKVIGMGKIDGVFWSEGMNKNGQIALLDRPEYAMAKGASFFHHYCYGMLEKHRYFTRDKRYPTEFYLQQWRDEMLGVVGFAKQHNPSWPHLHVIFKEIAEAYFYQKDYGNAIVAAKKSIELKPDFVQAYTLLANTYESIKEPQKGLEVVTEGLKYAPTSRHLQRRFKELGGKEPFPEPYSPPTQTPAVAEKDPIKAESLEKNAQNDSVPKATPEQIGIPGNPFCRFCPE